MSLAAMLPNRLAWTNVTPCPPSTRCTHQAGNPIVTFHKVHIPWQSNSSDLSIHGPHQPLHSLTEEHPQLAGHRCREIGMPWEMPPCPITLGPQASEHPKGREREQHQSKPPPKEAQQVGIHSLSLFLRVPTSVMLKM